MRKKKDLWFETLGYAFNPFTIKPGFFDDEVIGYDGEVDQLVKKLSEHKMYFLQGDFGQGKTTILKYLINEFSGQFKVLYISRNRSDRAFNYSSLLRGASNGFKKLFAMRAKNVVLIVDETAKINNADCEQIERYFKEGNFKSVLFIDKSFEESRLNKSIRNSIGKNVLTLKTLKPAEALEIVKSRLDGGEKLISDDLVKKVYDKSGKNTRQFLLNMEDVCRHAIDNGRKSVKVDDLSVLK